jgi:uncharacterized protein YjiS (DUF1127 family)
MSEDQTSPYKSETLGLMLHCVGPSGLAPGRQTDRPIRTQEQKLQGATAMTPFKTITEKLQAWLRYREAVRELSQLSDRELNDIGVRRGDIEFIVRQGASFA